MGLLESFKLFVKEHQLIGDEDLVLLACSGGVDSMVLADLFLKTQINFFIAHCNFGLRVQESQRDEDSVRSFCETNNVISYYKKFDTKNFAKEKKLSTQMAARELRYEWFKELASMHENTIIASAHHKNDLVETILINLTRGTGISGLHGILPVSGNIIRPLLFATKEQIIDYATENKIQYVEDSSNKKSDYIRNKIRQKVIPVLKEINPSLEDTLFKFAGLINSTEHYYFQHIERLKKEILSNDGSLILIDIEKLKREFDSKSMLFEIISNYGFNISQTKQIIDSIDSESGKIFLSEHYNLTKDRSKLIISEKSTDKFEITIDNLPFEFTYDQKKVRIEKVNINPNKIDYSIADHLLDFSKLKFPLLIRQPNKGDKFVPLGMTNFKKLSDFFIDNKVSIATKDKTLLVENTEEICCIIEHRIDERYKLNINCKEALAIHIAKK